MAITASVQPESGQMVYYLPDSTSRIQFGSVFPKKAWTISCKTGPDPMWMTWSGFGQTHLVWKQAGVQESSGPVSGRKQPARYQFLTFRLGSVLPQTSRTTLWKTSPVPIWFWLIVCARFGPNGSGPEASRCARTIRPASGQRFRADPGRVQIGSGLFTGFSS